MTRRLVAGFDEGVTVASPTESLQQTNARQSIYQKSLPLPPGRYRLHVTVKDMTAGTIGELYEEITVPQLDPEKPGASSLVLADLVERIPMKDTASGPFVIGDSRVRPRVGEVFKSTEKLGVFLKAYRLPSSMVQYELFREESGEKVGDFVDPLPQAGNVSMAQTTIQKGLSLEKMAPGRYTVRVTVMDEKRVPVSTTMEARFTVL
jgi:hypothetical protein